MKLKEDKYELRFERAPISLKTTAAGDYVLYRFTKKWYTVVKLVKVNSQVYADCLDTSGETKRILACDCYPSWNPRTKSFGREEGSARKKYWLP